MDNYRWNTESWGPYSPPNNMYEIIDAANSLLDEYAETHAEDLTIESDLHYYSQELWEEFCNTGSINGVTADYDGCEEY